MAFSFILHMIATDRKQCSLLNFYTKQTGGTGKTMSV